MKIEVRIDKSTALAVGTEPGTHVVDVPVATLSQEARQLLDAFLGDCFEAGKPHRLQPGDLAPRIPRYGLPPVVKAPTVDGILEACRDAAAQLAAARAKLEGDAARMLALPVGSDDAALSVLLPDSDVCRLVPALAERVCRERDARIRMSEERSAAMWRERLQCVLTDANEIRGWSGGDVQGNEARAVEAQISAILAGRRKARDAQAVADREQWLSAHGGAGTLAKMEAGYACTGEIKRLVVEWATERIEGLGIGLRVLAREDGSTSTTDRTSPSDVAFEAEQAIDAAEPKLFSAHVRWATWKTGEYDDDRRSAELISVSVACPWDDRQGEFVELEVVGDDFAE